MGLSVQQVAEGVKLPVSEIEKLRSKQQLQKKGEVL